MLVLFVWFLVWWANGFPAVHYGTDWYGWLLGGFAGLIWQLGVIRGKADAKSR